MIRKIWRLHPKACINYCWICLFQWLPTRDHFSSQGTLTVCGDIVGCHNLREGYWHLVNIGARDAAKRLTMHRIDPTTKNFLAQNVSSAKVEKP